MKCLNSSISVILCLFLKVLCWLKMVKNLPAMQETWVRTLGQEASLEKGMASYSSFLPWRTPWTEEPGWLQSMRSY